MPDGLSFDEVNKLRDGLSFDELNKLYDDLHDGESISEPFGEYFGAMGISRERRENRTDTAEALKDVFILALMMLYYMARNGVTDYAEVISTTVDGYRKVLIDKGIPVSDSFLWMHIQTAVMDIVATTSGNPDRLFNYTYDRATLIAENEANSVWDNAELVDAIATGKSTKTWHAFKDARTRSTHRKVDGTTIPITDPFSVGEYLMMSPKDDSLGAGMEEIANCRCWLTFS